MGIKGIFGSAEHRKKRMDEGEQAERDGVGGRLQESRTPRRQAGPDGGFQRSGNAGRPNRSREIPGAALAFHHSNIDIGDASLRIRMDHRGVLGDGFEKVRFVQTSHALAQQVLIQQVAFVEQEIAANGGF